MMTERGQRLVELLREASALIQAIEKEPKNISEVFYANAAVTGFNLRINDNKHTKDNVMGD